MVYYIHMVCYFDKFIQIFDDISIGYLIASKNAVASQKLIPNSKSICLLWFTEGHVRKLKNQYSRKNTNIVENVSLYTVLLQLQYKHCVESSLHSATYNRLGDSILVWRFHYLCFLLVQMLILQGAVPFIRTNIPQTCMSFDSTNPIYGVTCNPHSKQRSAGGSSGGKLL